MKLMSLPCFLLCMVSMCAHAQVALSPFAHIGQLRAELKQHDELYYEKAKSEISDTAYDALKRELETAYPELVSDDLPTRQICDDGRDGFFKRINEQRKSDGFTLHANPRNLTAGVMKLHDSEEAATLGFGEAAVEKLISSDLVRDAADQYNVRAEDLIKLDGVAKKSANRLCAAIDASRRAVPWRVLMGLGVPDVAATVRAKILAARYATLREIFAVDETELAQISGVGKKAASSIKTYAAIPANRTLLERLVKAKVGANKM